MNVEQESVASTDPPSVGATSHASVYHPAVMLYAGALPAGRPGWVGHGDGRYSLPIAGTEFGAVTAVVIGTPMEVRAWAMQIIAAATLLDVEVSRQPVVGEGNDPHGVERKAVSS